jgi:hypothetical protein
MTGSKIREAVGVFANAKDLEQAIDDLQEHGFDRAELSLLASEAAVAEKLSHAYTRVDELEDDPEAPRAAYVSTESVGDAEGALVGGLTYIGAIATAGAVVASGGTLGAAIAGAALVGGSGALIGSILASLVGNHHAEHIEEQIARGGLLLWVNIRDADHEKRATEILRRNGARDVHLHAIPAA